jgi:hypothetical protein
MVAGDVWAVELPDRSDDGAGRRGCAVAGVPRAAGSDGGARCVAVQRASVAGGDASGGSRVAATRGTVAGDACDVVRDSARGAAGAGESRRLCRAVWECDIPGRGWWRGIGGDAGGCASAGAGACSALDGPAPSTARTRRRRSGSGCGWSRSWRTGSARTRCGRWCRRIRQDYSGNGTPRKRRRDRRCRYMW